MLSVMIADDQAMVRSGLSLLLTAEEDIEVVGEARDGGEAVRVARERRPDVVLMDIRMPGMDGIEATRLLAGREVDDPLTVVILTTFGAEEYVVDALRAGAVGFVLKDSDPDTLLGAVRAAAEGAGLIDPAVTRQFLQRFATLTEGSGRRLPDEVAALTGRERDVFHELARGASNAEIAQRLYVEPSTVKTHVAHVLRKLGLRDRVEAVIYAYEHGLVEPGAAPDT
ncbi:MAG: response regulator transcription factor [Nitriliruptoraceae bacterium]